MAFRNAALAGLASSLLVRAALASDPLSLGDKPINDDDDKAPHTELNLVPLAGGSTDVGIGGGFFGGLARIEKGYDPYVYNLEAAGLVTFKNGTGGIELPVQDLYLKL